MATWLEKQKEKIKRDKLAREYAQSDADYAQSLLNARRNAIPSALRAPEQGLQGGMELGSVGGIPVSLTDLIPADFGANALATLGKAGAAKLGALPIMAGIFAGKGAKTANLAALIKAEGMAKKGIPDAQIWKETGWTLDTPDKLPRFEIPDNAARVNAGALDYVSRNPQDMPKIGSVVRHNDLYSAYPDTKDISLFTHKGSGAEFSEAGKGGMQSIRLSTFDEPKSPAIHELQHAIQQREGFARGGSPESFMRDISNKRANFDDNINFINQELSKAVGTPRYNELLNMRQDLVEKMRSYGLDDAIGMRENAQNQYKRLAGEAEARLTQARMAMTPEQRLAQYPYQPEYFQKATGVPLSDLIVRKDGGTAMNLPYQIEHKPMTIEGGASPLHDLTTSFGDDIYGRNALEYFGSGDPREKSTLRILQSLRGKPDAMVTIYRGAPANAGGINAGDWVTLDRKVAQDYVDLARENEGKTGKVFAQQVPASHVTSWPDSLLEFGYHPKGSK